MSSILNNYPEAITWLFNRFPSYQHLGAEAYKPGLETTKNLLQRVGNPQTSLNIIHVAGTNGKGSTCALTATLLQRKGLRVGLFTSPHLFDFRERIRINGKAISQARVMAFCEKLKHEAIDASFFEISLAMALEYFKELNCDWVVLETGMGGRLDATNVVLPKLSIITHIGLDHQTFLGDSLSAIANEKAGIIKPNVPLVCGERQVELIEIFRTRSAQNDSPFYLTTDSLPLVHPSIPSYQKRNLALAVKGLSVLGYETNSTEWRLAWEQLFISTGFLGRLTPSSEHPRLWFDVSHNEAGFSATMHALKEQFKGSLIVIYGSSSDKSVTHLADYMDERTLWYFTEFSNPRSYRKEAFLSLWADHQKNRWKCFDQVQQAITEAVTTRDENTGILVTGSFFQLSDVTEIQSIIMNHLNQ